MARAPRVTARHVLAGVVADTLDDDGRTAVAHAAALADHAPHEDPAIGGAVRDDVAAMIWSSATKVDALSGRTTSVPPDRPLPR
jgi:hypothetical protein